MFRFDISSWYFLSVSGLCHHNLYVTQGCCLFKADVRIKQCQNIIVRKYLIQNKKKGRNNKIHIKNTLAYHQL